MEMECGKIQWKERTHTFSCFGVGNEMSTGRWRKLRTRVPLGPLTVTFRDFTLTVTEKARNKIIKCQT